jgi:protein-tyrosine phosphatase
MASIVAVPETPARDHAVRHIELDGAVNFRDIGGYVTSTGQSVRWGAVYRADGLSDLSEADHAIMRSLGIRTVIDLRTTFEFENGTFPTSEVPVSLHHLPLMESVPDPKHFKTIPGFLASSYVEMLEQAGPHIAFALTLLASPENQPAIVHCTVGKDRTGVLVAVILGVLGIDDQTIIDDYALSARAMDEVRERLVRRFPDAEDLIRDHADEILSARPENMEFLLAGVHQQWGSMEDYARSIGVSSEAIASLRSALLEP